MCDWVVRKKCYFVEKRPRMYKRWLPLRNGVEPLASRLTVSRSANWANGDITAVSRRFWRLYTALYAPPFPYCPLLSSTSTCSFTCQHNGIFVIVLCFVYFESRQDQRHNFQCVLQEIFYSGSFHSTPQAPWNCINFMRTVVPGWQEIDSFVQNVLNLYNFEKYHWEGMSLVVTIIDY